MQIVIGIISPATKIPKTENNIAYNSDTALLKYIGRASRQQALQNSKVTSIQWCLLITAKIFFALNSIFLSCFAAISKVRWSIDASPIVRPDIMPENARSDKLKLISYHQAAENGMSSFCSLLLFHSVSSSSAEVVVS